MRGLFLRRHTIDKPLKASCVAIDVDSVAFHVASAAETSYITVKHNEAGWTKEFKNRTEFKGRAKKTLGGWLADENANRESLDQAPFSLEDFTIEDCYEPEPVENALYSTKQKLKSMYTQANKVVGADSHILIMGSGETYRHKLKLPVQYKSNRKDTRKPALLSDVRKYLKEYHGAIDIRDIEADDYIAQLGFKGWRDWKRTGVFSCAQGVVDKDAYQTNSLIWNPQKDYSGSWQYEEPILVDGLGGLWKNDKGKVKGTGFAWLMFQTFGDRIDGFECTNLTNKRYGFGDVARYETLKDCITPPEYLQAVLNSYIELFGECVQYEAWDGTEMDIPIVEYISMHFICAYMQRWKDDDTSFKGLCRKYGVDYD